jgi:putative oxidoreductase
MFDAFAKNTLVPLVLRLGLAVIFIYHGLEMVAGEGTQFGAAWAKETMPVPVQLAVAWGELIGGIALAVGFLTRLAALGIALIMIGAIVTVHGQHGFSLAAGGYEYNFAILVICAAVMLLGGGTWAVDRFFRLRRRT